MCAVSGWLPALLKNAASSAAASVLLAHGEIRRVRARPIDRIVVGVEHLHVHARRIGRADSRNRRQASASRLRPLKHGASRAPRVGRAVSGLGRDRSEWIRDNRGRGRHKRQQKGAVMPPRKRPRTSAPGLVQSGRAPVTRRIEHRPERRERRSAQASFAAIDSISETS
jgi:hypothetical protein